MTLRTRFVARPAGRLAPLLAATIFISGAVLGSSVSVGARSDAPPAGGPPAAPRIPTQPGGDGNAASTAYDPNAVNISWTKVVGGLSMPVLVTHAGDGSGRLFIVEQTGKIRVFKNGALVPGSYLDVGPAISRGSEQGLLGLAFHPDYATNGLFYVNFTLKTGDTAINEYRANPPGSDTVDWHTGRRVMTLDQPYSNHNGGHLAFGPDGYLWIGTGDGGSAGDPGNRAQNISSAFGKMMRIDVNGRANGRYSNPPDNPFVGKAGYDEIWARGLRNPWRYSFDRATGDLWTADVGQNKWEEVDVARAPGRGRNANYGWRIMEGRHCYNPSSGCSTSGKVSPIVEYAHAVSGEDNCSVTGGYVYRGTAYPDLVGAYLFGDYCSGRLMSISAEATSPATPRVHLNSGLHISSFGEDEAGEVYIVFHEGVVYHIVTY